MHSIVKLYNGIVLRLDIAFGLDLISMLLGYLQDNKLIRIIIKRFRRMLNLHI